MNPFDILTDDVKPLYLYHPLNEGHSNCH